MAPKNKKQQKGAKRKIPGSLRAKKKRLPECYYFSNYIITFDALEREDFPEEIESQYEELHDLIRENPKEAILRLTSLKEKYPEIPILYNWLFAAFSIDDQLEEAELIAKENYEKHPNYLFAKMNYAGLCFKYGEIEQIPKILDGKFDLKTLYPDREAFHVTEVVSFLSITGRYFVATDKIESAHACYKILMDIAPDHPATSQLMLKLAPSALDTLRSMH